MRLRGASLVAVVQAADAGTAITHPAVDDATGRVTGASLFKPNVFVCVCSRRLTSQHAA